MSKIDINSDVFSSRLFVKRDALISNFEWNGYTINIMQNRWWSRPFEYKWIEDVCASYFDSLDNRTVIDIATGSTHPGIFILKKLGFKKVIGTDLFDIDLFQPKNFISEGMEYVKDDILNPKIKEKFDCITFISVLEHFHPDNQRKVMENIISYLKDNGCLIFTFDMPGFDYLTNIPLYKEILVENKFSFREVDINKDDIVVKSSNCSNAGGLARKNLSCYRLFAWR